MRVAGLELTRTQIIVANSQLIPVEKPEEDELGAAIY